MHWFIAISVRQEAKGKFFRVTTVVAHAAQLFLINCVIFFKGPKCPRCGKSSYIHPNGV